MTTQARNNKASKTAMQSKQTGNERLIVANSSDLASVLGNTSSVSKVLLDTESTSKLKANKIRIK